MINEINPETVNSAWMILGGFALLLEIGVQLAIYFENRNRIGKGAE